MALVISHSLTDEIAFVSLKCLRRWNAVREAVRARPYALFWQARVAELAP